MRVLLIYPYFKPDRDRSIFRFPPLGVGYLATAVRDAGHVVELLDCTFLSRDEAFRRATASEADVVGIYSMLTMRADSLEFARRLRRPGRLVVAGGPLPSCDPESFMPEVDVVARGEGEESLVELLAAHENGGRLDAVCGLVYRDEATGAPAYTAPRPLRADLDGIGFPARDLYPNADYVRRWRHRGLPATTSVITTRGCPFRCEFCSNAVFGASYRERSAANVVAEVQQALEAGYRRIHFADDVFTLNRRRLLQVCREIRRRHLDFSWECLGRVDSLDAELCTVMRAAGCDRIFFGIESGDDDMLRLMGKRITVENARRAVEAAQAAGIRAGGFFILCYPGDTDETVLATIRFATSLRLDYLSFTMPYPLPYTALWERVSETVTREWIPPDHGLIDHVLTFEGDFSERKMRLAIAKGGVEHALRSHMGPIAPLGVIPFAAATDALFRRMR